MGGEPKAQDWYLVIFAPGVLVGALTVRAG